MHFTNVVVQADLGCSFDLQYLSHRLINVRYQPTLFSGMIWQHRRIGGNCLVFSNGKINCSGAAISIQQGRQRLRRYARLLQRMGCDVQLLKIRIVTVSAVHQLSGKIDPTNLPIHFSYEPELFPAVMFRRDDLHFTCHLSGKVIITGIKRDLDLETLWSVILELELYI